MNIAQQCRAQSINPIERQHWHPGREGTWRLTRPETPVESANAAAVAPAPLVQIAN